MTKSAATCPAVAATRLSRALAGADSSRRLQTALAAGTRPALEYVGVLVARCAVEPDFYVRDTLTWALTRHPAAVTVPLLLSEVRKGVAQARSQALHTLSKIGDPRGWSAITRELLHDPGDEVARSAWRAAVALVPAGDRTALAQALASQLGRGDRDVRLSLSRALAGLGGAADAALAAAASHGAVEVRTHAIATQRLARDPDEGFDAAVFEAERALALMDASAIANAPATDASSAGLHADR